MSPKENVSSSQAIVLSEEKQHPSSQEPIQELAPSSTASISAESVAQVTVALSHMESRYRANVKAYAQELHACNQKIELLKSERNALEAQQAPEKKRLEAVEKEIEHQMKMLEYLHKQWMQKCTVAIELKKELANLASEEERKKVLEGHYGVIDALSEEVEAVELTLLEHELERQNLMLQLEPVAQKIRTIEQEIEALEAQKRYIESAHLHQITDMQHPEPTTASGHLLEQKS